jgi:hypothetical protein
MTTPVRIGPDGEGLAVLVNANAKRGGRRVAVQIARALPGAVVKLTRQQAEMDEWLSAVLAKGPGPAAFVAAGGDGTAQALVGGLHRVRPGTEPLPPLGILPLGTGNAWANATGAPKLRVALARIAEAGRTGLALPLRRFGLVECEGHLTHMCGSGWDAQVLNDYKEQVASAGNTRLSKSVYGYLSAMLFRTTPKVMLKGLPDVIVENLGKDVYTLDGEARVVPLAGAGPGTVLYDGPSSVAGCATCPEYGYRFKAFPFAERFLGRMSVRVYNRAAPAAIKDIPKLWTGRVPLAGMHDWFATHVRMTFSRPMPLQIGGDACGVRHTVEYRIAPREAHVIDWRFVRG